MEAERHTISMIDMKHTNDTYLILISHGLKVSAGGRAFRLVAAGADAAAGSGAVAP